MYEFFGWIKIIETTADFGNSKFYNHKVESLKSLISSFAWSMGKCTIECFNGYHVLTIAAIPNRKRSESKDLYELLDFIVLNFPASYGLVNEYNEKMEFINGHGGFETIVIRRGQFDVISDIYLTPFVPLVENQEST